MSNLFCASAAVVLAGFVACGCTSTHSSYLASEPRGEMSVASAIAPVSTAESVEASARTATYAQAGPITTVDVIQWSACGVRDDVIVERIERSPSVFHLTAADENQLRDKGVSEAVIQEMRATARR